MTYWKSGGHVLSVPLFLIGIVLVSACTKPTTIGQEEIANLDRLPVKFTDTLTLLTTTMQDDTIFTSNQSTFRLGSMDDPAIGKTYGAVHSQIFIPTNNIDLGDSLTIDSVVLQLRYNGYYGDPAVAQSFTVHKLTEDMDPLSPYYDYSTFDFEAGALGRIDNFVPASGDTTLLRIPLTDTLGQYFLDQSGDSLFESLGSFLEQFKGIIIQPDTSAGYGAGMLDLDLNDPLSMLTLYYHAPNEDSLEFNFPIPSGGVGHGYYKHQYSNSDIRNQLQTPGFDTATTFIQGLGGLLTEVQIPHIDRLGEITIMQAELLITQVPLATDSVFEAPAAITIRVRNTDTTAALFQTLFDETWQQTQLSYEFGGLAETIQIKGKSVHQYRFNLLRHLQFVVDNELDNMPLLIKAYPSSIEAGRMAIGSGQHSQSQYRMKLNLYYTPK